MTGWFCRLPVTVIVNYNTRYAVKHFLRRAAAWGFREQGCQNGEAGVHARKKIVGARDFSANYGKEAGQQLMEPSMLTEITEGFNTP